MTATIAGSTDRVRAAKLDWGYTNFFRYGGGHADSAAARMNDDLWLVGDVGTNYGGDRESDEWVSVAVVRHAIATGEFSSGFCHFRVPSWAPPSSTEIARWSCRLDPGPGRTRRGGSRRLHRRGSTGGRLCR